MRELVLRSIFLMSFGYLPILSMYKIILYMTSLLFHFHIWVFLHLLPLESQSTLHVLYFVLETSFINSRTQALLLSGFCLTQNMSSQDTSLEAVFHPAFDISSIILLPLPASSGLKAVTSSHHVSLWVPQHHLLVPLKEFHQNEPYFSTGC